MPRQGVSQHAPVSKLDITSTVLTAVHSLAYCELYLMVAAMALRVLPRAQLHETTIEDIEYDHDLIVPQSKHGSIRVGLVIS